MHIRVSATTIILMISSFQISGGISEDRDSELHVSYTINNTLEATLIENLEAEIHRSDYSTFIWFHHRPHHRFTATSHACMCGQALS